jgi:sulfate transport system ATP-binding protein
MTVSVENVTKRFGKNREVVGVQSVTFTAPDHAITSLLGPSGSGKSTLLRMIAGLELADEGVVRIHGDDVTQLPVQERRVGFVFQNYALFKHMTVFENVAFGLRIQKRAESEIKDRVSELLGLVQLAGYERRLPDPPTRACSSSMSPSALSTHRCAWSSVSGSAASTTKPR